MLSSLQQNLEKLIAAYEAQKQKTVVLEQELGRCREQLENARKRNNKLEEEIGILKERTVFLPSTPDNYNMAKAKVDALIKEIDEALALLQ